MRKCLTVYVFLVRAYYLEDEELQSVLDTLAGRNLDLQKLHRLFYLLYESGFCTRSSERGTINVHTFQHYQHARWTQGPLWKTSAEPFEAMYHSLQRMYQRGTKNVCKQMFENFYLKTK